MAEGRGGGDRDGRRPRARPRARRWHAHRSRPSHRLRWLRHAPLFAPCLDLRVRRRKRMIFVLRCAEPLPGLLLVIDPSGASVRPEGERFMCVASPPAEEDQDVAAEDFDLVDGFFEERVWAPLAARVPALERIRLDRAWAGHYDANTFDHNVFAGQVPRVGGRLPPGVSQGTGCSRRRPSGAGLSRSRCGGGLSRWTFASGLRAAGARAARRGTRHRLSGSFRRSG